MKTTKATGREISDQVGPFFEMLEFKKKEMWPLEWAAFVQRIRQSILQSPEQYLSVLIEKNEVSIINNLFDEFLHEQSKKAESRTVNCTAPEELIRLNRPLN